MARSIASPVRGERRGGEGRGERGGKRVYFGQQKKKEEKKEKKKKKKREPPETPKMVHFKSPGVLSAKALANLALH